MRRSRRTPALAAALALWLAAGACSAQVERMRGTTCCSALARDSMAATPYGATIARVPEPADTQAESPVGNTEASGGEGANPQAQRALVQLDARVQQLQAADGPMAATLAPALAELGEAQLDAGNTAAGIAALKRGIHLRRINEGLYTPSQIPLVERLIATYVALGDYVAADQQEAYLYRLRSWGAVGGAAVLESTLRYADWVRAAYLGDLDATRYPRLMRLNDLYEESVDRLSAEYGDYDPELLPYLRGLVDVAYLVSVYPGERETGFSAQISQPNDPELASATQLRFWRLRDHNFRYGRQALEHREEILQRDPDSTPAQRAAAHLALADWYQWHSRYATAIRLYEETWAMMEDAPGGELWRRDHLGEPRELPAHGVFSPGPLPIAVPNSEQVSVRFHVSRHGEARDITVLEPAAAEAIGTRVNALNYLRNLRFRPILADGRVSRSAPVERRYVVRY